MAQQRKYNYLVADDEQSILKVICDILVIHPNTLSVFTANDGEKAYQLYRDNKIDVVLTDVLMPGLSGIELIQKLKEVNQDVSIIVVSASSNLDIVREALRNGAYDYIIKPFSVDDIMFSINRVIERLKLKEEKDSYLFSLEKQKEELTVKIQSSYFDSLKVILGAIEAKSNNVYTHSKNVSELSERLSKAMNLEPERVENIKIGAILHDIGLVGVPESILLKAGNLDEKEYNIVKEHTIIGKKILEPMEEIHPDIIDFVYFHHERFDGKGYPEGLKGKKIPLPGRIGAVVNAYDAMMLDKPYRKAKTKDEALSELKNNMGTQFDPEIVRLFVNLL